MPLLRTLAEAVRVMRRCPAEAIALRLTGREAQVLPVPDDLSGLREPFAIPPPPGARRAGTGGATWMPILGRVEWEDDPDVHADADLLRRWSRGRLREVLHAATLALDERDAAAAAFAVRRTASFLARCEPFACEHWSSGMETGLRAMRLLHAAWRLRLAAQSGIAVPSLAPVARALALHEQALRRRTDWRFLWTGNHFLVALASRVALSAALPDHDERRRRLRSDERLFLSELDRQSGDLGMHFEASTHYFLLAAECAAHVQGTTGRGDGQAREAMRSLALPSLLRPDGSIASVGDGDDESFVPAIVGPEPPPVLRAREIADALGAGPEPDAAAWADGGVHVLSLGGLHATISSAWPGRAGTGGHFHDDATSYELWLLGPLLGHRGTGAYAGDAALRQRLRSVRSHAALQSGSREMNDARRGHAFRRRHRAQAFVVPVPGAHLAIGHHGFVLPAPGAAVLRTFRMDAGDGFVVEDRVTGAGSHRLTLRLPWAPGVEPSAPRSEADGSWAFVVRRDGRSLASVACRTAPGARCLHVPDTHWPRQGEPEDAVTTEISWEGRLPVVIRHSVRPVAWGAPGSP